MTKIYYKGQKASLLTYTSDMAAYSFSLPAGYACPMKNWTDESYICHGCYAMINRYNMPNVLRSQTIRFMWTKEYMKTVAGRLAWTNIMVKSIRKHVTNGYFRGHDSGDFFHPSYVRMWYFVCYQLPDIKFWFPTRCYDHNKSWNINWEIALTQLNSLPNVTVRPSALKWNDMPPSVPYMSKGTTAIDTETHLPNVVTCAKTLNGGSCEDNKCRVCWDNEEHVGYLVHGYMGHNQQPNARTDNIKSIRDKIYKLTISEKQYEKTVA